MANPSAIDGNPAVLAVTDSASSVTLNPRRAYDIGHDGYKVAGGTGDTETGPIYLSTDDGVAPAAGAVEHKIMLVDGRSVSIGPDVSYLAFKGSVADVTMTIVPGPELLGEH